MACPTPTFTRLLIGGQLIARITRALVATQSVHAALLTPTMIWPGTLIHLCWGKGEIITKPPSPFPITVTAHIPESPTSVLQEQEWLLGTTSQGVPCPPPKEFYVHISEPGSSYSKGWDLENTTRVTCWPERGSAEERSGLNNSIL